MCTPYTEIQKKRLTQQRPSALQGPTCNTSYAHAGPRPKLHLDGFSRFCTDDRRLSLYFTMGRPFPPQNFPFPWGIWTAILYMVPWVHPSPQPKGISIGAAVFAGLTSVTDRQTDRPTDRPTVRHSPTDHAIRSVTIGRIYVYT